MDVLVRNVYSYQREIYILELKHLHWKCHPNIKIQGYFWNSQEAHNAYQKLNLHVIWDEYHLKKKGNCVRTFANDNFHYCTWKTLLKIDAHGETQRICENRVAAYDWC